MFVLMSWSTRKTVALVLCAFIAVVIFHSGRGYIRFLRSEPAENIRPMIPIIAASPAKTLWVHSCSIEQVRTLPDPLPIPEVVDGTNRMPEPGQKILVLWTHLGSGPCHEELERLRHSARQWQIVHQGPDRGLALAEF
jgi:hypothetical protein